MPLPAALKARLEHLLESYCSLRVPAELADQLRIGYKIDGTLVTLVEERPSFDRPAVWTVLPIARFRYNLTTRLWTLFWADRNSRWHTYAGKKPTKTILPLLREVDQDPTGIFWG